MNADHAFYIGNTHPVCQDYALSGVVENGAFAIVCDGCSASPDVDFGARALALSAKRTLGISTDMNYDIFGKITVDNIKSIGDYFPLHPQALDSTLLVAFVKDNMFKVHIYGDGVFFHKSEDNLHLIHVDFESNTPAYLSYYLDKLRLKRYEDTVIGSKHIIDISISKEGFQNFTDVDNPNNVIETENYIKPFEAASFEGKVKVGDVIGVCSDGINTFKDANSSDINWRDMICEFIDYKSTQGVFVQRRMGFIKRQWAKTLTTHYDDVSISAIVV